MSEEEWEILDYYCYEEEKEDGKWWKMVMEAGKKLVITGVVISSAPVVLPPLLVVSALGFAMSLPFGVVFASYACTHKLMTKLLPPPPPPPPSPSPYEVDLEEEAEEEMMMIKKEIEMRIELQVDDESDVQVGGESEKDIGEKNKLEEREIDESSTSTSTSSENENGSVNIDEDTKQSKELDSEKIKQQIISMNDDAAISSSLDKQHNKTTHEVLPAAAAAVVDVDPDHRGDEEDLKIVGEVNDKEWESKIWEKINAIRVIVGFKAPRRSSYLEEVKALYLFTGIDPPSTSEYHQLDDNLCFLMSVIGLK